MPMPRTLLPVSSSVFARDEVAGGGGGGAGYSVEAGGGGVVAGCSTAGVDVAGAAATEGAGSTA